jgi:hypothetical protein
VKAFLDEDKAKNFSLEQDAIYASQYSDIEEMPMCFIEKLEVEE